MRRSTTLLAAAALALPLASPALATFPVLCTNSAGTMTVSFQEEGFRVTIVRSGEEIVVRMDPSSAVPCGTPEVDTIDRIEVEDLTEGDIGLTVDLSGGPFAPGATAEPTGTSEIEFDVVFSTGSLTQRLTIAGRAGRDDLRLGGFGFGGSGVNVNGDDDRDDLMLSNVDQLVVRAAGGRDRVSADGVGFDQPYLDALTLRGGGGGDTLEAGSAGARIRGDGGPDLLLGGEGRDLLHGGPGGDRARGRGGRDRVVGADGDDRLRGNGGGDDLSGGPGDDVLGGGGGRDRCRGGPGIDALRSCER